jgi:pyruvate/2-oxoglutarate dehydrogenase complex dihydrolipoamide acyltransferase (E2) component
MPQIPIIMPQLGESIAEATIVNFLAEPGSEVQLDQDIIEVETSKATMTVTAPCTGRIDRLQVQLNESYAVGAVLGFIEASAEEVARAGLDTQTPNLTQVATPAVEAHAVPEAAPETKPLPTAGGGLPVPASATGAGYLSPRLKARMNELGLHAADLSGIAGTGAGGRVTVQDLEKFLSSLEPLRQSPASSMRLAVADAMRRSCTRPLASAGLPVSFDALLAHRKASNPKPGPALYACRALGIALAENSAVAGRLIGSKIVLPSAIDIGCAVEVDDGVLVPVLRGADKKPLRELVARYDELVQLAQQRRLPQDATGGAIATITNFGVFGLTWGTPIPLPEQSLVLGLGAGRKVPQWDEAQERFVPVTEAVVTLGFDHRLLDGGAAGRLLQRIAALLQTPEKL